MAKRRRLSNADYGYITFRDKRKLKDVKFEYDIEPEIRKPSPAEREEIVLNLMREKGRCSFKIRKLAKLLFVTDRTIQLLLRKLEREGRITITPRFTKTRKQRGNIYTYNGEPSVPQGGLTLQALYDPDNPAGFRDFYWESYKFTVDDTTSFERFLGYQRVTEAKEELKAKREAFRKGFPPKDKK